VRRFGGFVAKYMGDGVLVYFGYPQASQDDAEQAVRSGLALIEAIGALKGAVSLRTRVGIATALVVVGDLIGSGEAQERGIVGETPNLAGRLQGLATPQMRRWTFDRSVVSEVTKRNPDEVRGGLVLSFSECGFGVRSLGSQECAFPLPRALLPRRVLPPRSGQ
jgi:class 3 adenylate cyclase